MTPERLQELEATIGEINGDLAANGYMDGNEEKVILSAAKELLHEAKLAWATKHEPEPDGKSADDFTWTLIKAAKVTWTPNPEPEPKPEPWTAKEFADYCAATQVASYFPAPGPACSCPPSLPMTLHITDAWGTHKVTLTDGAAPEIEHDPDDEAFKFVLAAVTGDKEAVHRIVDEVANGTDLGKRMMAGLDSWVASITASSQAVGEDTGDVGDEEDEDEDIPGGVDPEEVVGDLEFVIASLLDAGVDAAARIANATAIAVRMQCKYEVAAGLES